MEKDLRPKPQIPSYKFQINSGALVQDLQLVQNRNSCSEPIIRIVNHQLSEAISQKIIIKPRFWRIAIVRW
jgi:hypothetical protein